MTLQELQKVFEKTFDKSAERIFFCPGRVNLIGEHIDYNGGNVMPCAISLGTTLLISSNHTNEFHFKAIGFDEEASVAVNKSGYTKSGSEWYNYPLGVIHEIQKRGAELGGYDFLFYGNLPIGSGLSSSASIEVLTAYALNDINQLGISNEQLAILGKQVENEFMGLNSGIMDQFAVAMGKEQNAILLNTHTLDYEYLPFETGDYTLMIMNSNKPRKLVESKYNERFSECNEALDIFKHRLNITALCDLTPDDFEQKKELLQNDILEKRVRHVVTENHRVYQAKEALLSGDVHTFGKLMYASHDSLQNDYEVSGIELDTLVDFCKAFNGCIGARMTGAGFGGCAIALIKQDSVDDFANEITRAYTNKVGYAPGIFSSAVSDGVRALL